MIKQYDKYFFSILRIAIGFLFLWHGTQKYFNYPPLPPKVIMPLSTIAIGGTIEFVGGILICIGLWTRVAAFLACGEMAYAYWFVHAKRGILPMTNGGELALLYCFVFMFFVFYGSGTWSIDSIFRNRKKHEFS